MRLQWKNMTLKITRNIAITSQRWRVGVIRFFSLSNEKIPSVTPLGPHRWSRILLNTKIHLNRLTMLRRLVQANCVVQGTGSPKGDQCFLGNVNTFCWRRDGIGAVVSLAPYKAGLLAGYGSALQIKQAQVRHPQWSNHMSAIQQTYSYRLQCHFYSTADAQIKYSMFN